MTNNSLERLKSEIAGIRRNSRRGRLRPHKLVLLLAAIEMAEEGLLAHNCIYFDERLTTRFGKYFDLYKRADDLCQPSQPFFHLRSAPFWNHKLRLGKEGAYGKLDTSGGGSKRILETIEFAYFSDYAFEVIEQETTRRELRAFIESILGKEGR